MTETYYGDKKQIDVNERAFDAREENNKRMTKSLKALLDNASIDTKDKFAKKLEEIGFRLEEGFREKSLQEMMAAARGILEEMEGIYSTPYELKEKIVENREVAVEGVRANVAVGVEANSEGENKERRLSPELEAQTLQALLARSKEEKYTDLCPGIDWERVERTLRKTPEALWTVHQAREHKPVIYFADETGFKIGSNLCEEPPLSSRNCVGTKRAAAWLKENRPDEKFNRDAETHAEKMGWELMKREEGKHFASNTPEYIEGAWRYYHTPDDRKGSDDDGPGFALYGNRFGFDLNVFRYDAYVHDDDGGWAGSLRVNYVD